MSNISVDALIEVSPGEIRVALVDREGRLKRLCLERISSPSIVGGIYLGRVTKVEKGMGAAFIDIGIEAPAFLGRVRGLHEGEAVVVQVIRDAWGHKSAGVTLTPQLEGRYLSFDVCRDSGPSIKYERNVFGSSLRARLEEKVENIVQVGERIQVKATADSIDESQLKIETERLRQCWYVAQNSVVTLKPPYLLEAAPRLVRRLLVDTAMIRTIVIDDRLIYDETERLVAAEMPDLDGKITFHGDNEPLFRAHGIDEQIEEALERRVSHPSGLTLTFDQTEALTAIDVDLGGAGARTKHEEACVRANLDAVPLIARQISLRNLAGLIVVDFISMRNKTNRRRIVEEFRKGLREGTDGAIDVLGMTSSGLVEVTRQRRGPSLADFYILNQPPVSAPAALACAALRDAIRVRGPGRPILVAADEVIAVLEGPLSPALEETSRRLGQPLGIRPEPGRVGFEILLE